MPKQTFFNLPEDKRERILNAAIDEFAKYYYHKASITRIVKSAGIAKGSFYQYFEDKKDLFKYLIDKIAEDKMNYLQPVMGNIEEMDFFQVLRKMYYSVIKYAKLNPKLQEIGFNLVRDNDTKFKEEILGPLMPKSIEIFKWLLKKGVEKGEIDSSINIDLTATIINGLNNSVDEYVVDAIKHYEDSKIIEMVEKMIYIIENGIKKKGREE